MQLRDIEYVVTIAEKKKFSLAAEALFISQPALSQAIQKLEAELGVSLFTRKRTEAILTEAGRLFVEDGRKILEHSTHIKKQMHKIQNLEAGKLTIGITPLFGQFYFSDPYIKFRKIYPHIDITIMEDISESLERQLSMGKFDFILLPLPIRNTHFDYLTVVSEETFLALPKKHPINGLIPPGKDGYCHITMHHFRHDPFIMLRPGQRLRTIGMEACRLADFEPDIVFETSYINTANALVSAGLGISFIPYMIFSTRNDNGGNVYYHIDGMDTRRTLVAAYEKGGTLTPAAKAFIKILLECYTPDGPLPSFLL